MMAEFDRLTEAKSFIAAKRLTEQITLYKTVLQRRLHQPVPAPKKRLQRYSLAVKRWIAAGRPVRSDEEVARIHTECCVPCTHYNPTKQACGVCGCNVRADGEDLLSKVAGALFGKVSQALFNKIKMATTDCPRGKWKDVIGNLLPVKFTTPMDVVYPISGGCHGKKKLGSKWGDNELRYSLRSLEQYFANMGRVFIVGHKPEWLTNVIHIQAEDTHWRNKDANLIDKVLLACRSGVSPTFLRLSDDQCLLKEWDGLKVWHMGSAAGRQGGKWWKRMQRTCDYLQSHGRPTFFYDCHAPAPVDRETFIRVAEEADYAPPPGMCINTLYFNSVDIPRERMNGQKVAVHRGIGPKKLRRLAKDKLFLGYSEAGTNKWMKRFLQKRFPGKSRFER